MALEKPVDVKFSINCGSKSRTPGGEEKSIGTRKHFRGRNGDAARGPRTGLTIAEAVGWSLRELCGRKVAKWHGLRQLGAEGLFGLACDYLPGRI